MKQMSTGFGLAVLGACVLGAAFIASPRFGQQAFAQVTGDRHIVSVGFCPNANSKLIPYRIWSDNAIEARCAGWAYAYGDDCVFIPNTTQNFQTWRTIDNGLTTFVPADVDASGNVDNGDVGQVLLNIGETQAGNPPPPIDCTINAPR